MSAQVRSITLWTQREAALALLNKGENLNRRSGSFLGQCVADDSGRLRERAIAAARLLEFDE